MESAVSIEVDLSGHTAVVTGASGERSPSEWVPAATSFSAVDPNPRCKRAPRRCCRRRSSEDPEIETGVVAMSGIGHDVKKGERLPDAILESAQAVLGDFIFKPDDIAHLVMYVLGPPGTVGVTEIVIRPNKRYEL